MDQDFIETAEQNNLKKVPNKEKYHSLHQPFHANEWKKQDDEEIEDDSLTLQEESGVKEVTFVLNGKQEKFVIAKEVQAVVDQFPDDEDLDFSI